jgi:hypothetical protein
VRSNAVSPSARTRIETSLKPPPPGVFDVFDPDNVSPLVVWLATADCPATNQVFQVYGDRVEIIGPSRIAVDVRCGSTRWDLSALDAALRHNLPPPAKLSDFVEGLGI